MTTLRTITGELRHTTGELLPETTIVIAPVVMVSGDGGDVAILGDAFEVTSDESGLVEFEAYEGDYDVEYPTSRGKAIRRGRVDTAGPWTMGRFLGPVGSYGPTLAQQVEDDAAAARAAAAAAEASAAAAGAASGRFVITAFSQLATKFVDADPAEGQVILPVGGIVVDEKTGNRWERVTTGENLDYTGTGGVKLYVMPVGSDFQAAAFGIVGVSPAGSPFDERAKIATAFQAAGVVAGATGGISIVHFEPDRIYGITNLVRRDCVLPAGVGFDLHGSMITRVGGIITVPMIENANTGIVGGTPTRDHHIRNGKLRGTGAPGAVSDQGAALLLFESDGTSFITNIETIDTNGDGLAFRNATVVMKDVVIGDFGRNGISPTSGGFVYDNVRVIGTAISGADPGIGIDAENNSSGEFGKHVMYYVEAPDITFVDFWASSGTEFRHEVEIYAGKIGETYRGLRFLSQNPTVANKIAIHEGVLIGAGGVGGAAVWIDNVSGIRMVGPTLDVGSATGSMNAISLDGTITSLMLHGVEQTGAFSSFIVSTAATAVSGIEMLGCGVTSRLYLHNCTGSYFSDGVASNVTLSGATTGNIFSPTFRVPGGVYTLVSGATKEAQRIGYMLTEAEIDGEYGLAGPVLRMRGRRSFSSHGLGEIVGFSNEPGSEASGASVKFSGSNLTEGVIDFYTCTTGARVNRMRIGANGGVLMYALPVYADDAAAGVGGLVAGALYRTAAGAVRVKT